MGENLRKHIIFYGRVQGVGFRYRAYYSAKNFGLSGWVRNLYDGTVEMEVQGREELIHSMLKNLNQDHYIRIDHMETEQIPLKQDESGFRVR
ncbi:MAG: acylphosphatase [Lachnospiraceae bacterium]|nr:acylphosphatase [Lachnospiraceae bacterium]